VELPFQNLNLDFRNSTLTFARIKSCW